MNNNAMQTGTFFIIKKCTVKVTKTGKKKKAPHRSEMLLFSHVTTKHLL
jgi:hypothetical protein